jgi:hypothetical protein
MTAQPNVLPSATAGSSSPGSAQTIGAAATITFTLSPSSGASANSSSRSPMTVSPSTKTIYVALQNTAGNGNSTFAYTLPVNATSCSGSSGNCTYTIQLPIGNDLVSILAVNALDVPLDYAGSVPFAVVANAPNMLRVALQPILAKAVPSYAFQQFNGSSAYYPLVSASAVYDAVGDAIATSGTFPLGAPYSQINISQTAGMFDTIAALNSGQGSYQVLAGPIAAGSSTQFVLAEHGGYALELGTGNASWFTTTVTMSTPQVQFTQTEFPQLPTPTITVPASSNAICLSCRFTAGPITPGGLAANPCTSTASVTIGVF